MNRFIALSLAVLPLLCSCASNVIYRPASKPEKAEFQRDLLDVYPGDVRRNLDLYTNIGVGWAGIIRETTATDSPDGTIHAVTTFEHHYFDWQEDRGLCGAQLAVSPRGEGLFTTEWDLERDENSGSAAAENYASPGKLAIVYGVPEKVDNGTVVLRYRYLRIVEPDHFSTNQFDYGRFGEPLRFLDNPPVKSN